MEKWDFQTALDYGIRYVYAKAQSEGLGGAKKESTREEMPLDRVDGVKKEEVVMWDCWRCLRRHERGIATCTAMKKACAECDKTGHVKGSTYCSAYKKAEKAARNARSDRDRGRSDRGRGGGGNNSSWNSGVRGGKTKEIRYMDRDGKQRTKTIRWVEVNEPEETGNDEGWEEEDFRRVLSVAKLSKGDDIPVNINITPTAGTYRTKVPWTVDSGVRKTMLSERHLGWILERNPKIELRPSKIRFRPYSTYEEVPILGCMQVRLRNNMG